MPAGSIARRYARALMSIGVEDGTYEALGRQVGVLAGAMKTSDELTQTLSNPAFPRADRRRILSALLERIGASKTVENFVLLLLDRERMGVLPDIARELDRMIDERTGRISAEVVSAQPLNEAQTARIKETLEKISGKQVQLSKREDPELLGGVVAKLGDVVYDGSLRTQLNQMRESLVG
ncbi:ATP synthase F1 subunit delta [Haliangium ochraceum]|uniref:ATP synthase subunit delta n=1 Tax=Haliangium ochraceum (strain DSM 14365 / JCM 11303 / SMP-2) TaxID=502025 RepID=D0LL44_HALO1|nr:ATP synthase F1 subunit delta [Haliangium ochraceum]ACY18540.1 ATP synthase F1, delta subunit [Haliangium ochraceum DSM 14365]